MNIVFEISAASPAQFPEATQDEIAFVGRSNVGKSSLLNMLVGIKQLARVSATPGKTQQINFFSIDGKLRLVDLPGYGYAKASQRQRQAWGKLMTAYFEQDRPLRMIVQLIDSRLPPQVSDSQVLAWFLERRLPVQLVMTKIDKLRQSDRVKQPRLLLAGFRELGYTSDILCVSSLSGYGKKELSGRLFTHARE